MASVDEARRLFAEGLAFVEQGNWVSAEERFRRVLAQRSSHVVVYNLASALVHLDRLVEGAELLRSILRAADADAETREAAQQLLSETEPRIGTLTVRVSGDATFTAFTLDDKPIELTAQVQTIAVDPGEHRIAALREGAEVASQRVVLGNGQVLQAEVELVLPALITPQQALRPEPALPPRRVAPPAPRPLRDDEADEGGSSFWLWAGGGAVVVAAAAVTLALVLGGSEEAAPVAGDTDPGFIRGRVR